VRKTDPHIRIVITGATGFIGRALCAELKDTHELIALSRDARKAVGVIGGQAQIVEWDGHTAGAWAREVNGARAVVHLAGQNIASGRWTSSTKATIMQSRLQGTRAILDAIQTAKDKPSVLVQISAVGYYGLQAGDAASAEMDESHPPGKGFLAEVCTRVEDSAARAEALGVRTVMARLGMVLGPGGGALPRLIRPFRFHLGGYVGNGRTWVSWTSLHDTVRAIRFLVEHDDLHGPFNVTSPQPVTMKTLCRAIGEALGRRAWIAVPGFLVRVAISPMADEAILNSLRVSPKRLHEAGFVFERPDVKDALARLR
jgi:uncharacterized protein (TIGR01777 family)